MGLSKEPVDVDVEPVRFVGAGEVRWRVLHRPNIFDYIASGPRK